EEFKTVGAWVTAPLRIARYDEDATIQATYWAPANILDNSEPKIVVLANAQTNLDKSTPPTVGRSFLEQGLALIVINRFSTSAAPYPFSNFSPTNIRTLAQQRGRVLLTESAAAGAADPRKPITFKVILTGTGQAGLWALLAAPGADAVAAD